MSNPLIQHLQYKAESLKQEAEATQKTLDILNSIEQSDAAILVTSNQMQVRMLPVLEVGPQQAINMLTAVIKTIISNMPNNESKQKLINQVRNTIAAVDQTIQHDLAVADVEEVPAPVHADDQRGKHRNAK